MASLLRGGGAATPQDIARLEQADAGELQGLLRTSASVKAALSLRGPALRRYGAGDEEELQGLLQSERAHAE